MGQNDVTVTLCIHRGDVCEIVYGQDYFSVCYINELGPNYQRRLLVVYKMCGARWTSTLSRIWKNCYETADKQITQITTYMATAQ